jgi:hypothetical protein
MKVTSLTGRSTALTARDRTECSDQVGLPLPLAQRLRGVNLRDTAWEAEGHYCRIHVGIRLSPRTATGVALA